MRGRRRARGRPLRGGGAREVVGSSSSIRRRRRAARPSPESSYGHAAKLFVPLRRDSPPRAVISVPERYWAGPRWAPGTGPAGRERFAGSPPALGGSRSPTGRTLARVARRLRAELDLDPPAPCCPPGRTTRGSAPPTRPPPAAGGRAVRSPGRSTRLRRRAPGRRVRRAHGGRYSERPRAARALLTVRVLRRWRVILGVFPAQT